MKLSFRSALGAFFVLAAITLGSLPARAQSSFPTPGGSYVDGHALMCPNGSTDFQGRPVMVPCGGSSNPVQVNASVSASISGFTPTPSYSTGTTSASDQTVALPTGTEFILTNNGSSAMAWNIGAAATGSMNVLQPNSWIAFSGTGGAAFHYIEATGAAGTSAFSISGGAGLPTGAGGGSAGSSGGAVTIAHPVDSINGGVLTTGAPNSTTTGVITTADVGQTCTSVNWGGQTACTGTPTAGSAYQVAVNSAGYIWLQANTTSGTPTVNFAIRISNDGGTTWFNRGIFALTGIAPFQINGLVALNWAGWITGGVTNVEVDAVTYTGSGSTTITVTQGQATPFVTSSATSSSATGSAGTAATNIQGNGPSALPVGTNSQQLAGAVLAGPTATGVAPAGGALVPNVNAAITGGSVTASFGQWAPNGNNAQLTVGASSSSVALPSGTVVTIDNTGSNTAFFHLGVGSATATAADTAVPSGGFKCVTVGSNTFLGAIETAGATALNINGGSGGCAGAGGGGGGGSFTWPGTAGNGSLGATGSGTAPYINAYLPAITSQTLTVANPAVSTFGSTGPASGAAMGTNGQGPFDPLIQAHSSVAINITTAVTTQLVALSSAKSIYITSWDVMAPSGNFTLEYGTGTLCGTGTTALTGPEAMSGGQVGKGVGIGTILIVPASNALCAVTSAAAQYSGSVSYTQF